MKLTMLAAALATALTLTPTAKAETVSTATVLSETVDAFWSCSDWGITGVCAFLKCGWFSCKTVFTPWVEHWAPDLTIQTYRDAEEPPWDYTGPYMTVIASDHDGAIISGLLSAIGSPVTEAGGGAGSENDANNHNNTTFALADAFGNPLMNGAGLIPGVTDIVCVPKLNPLQHYYISNQDIEWRIGLVEMFTPEMLNPFAALLGDTTENWGHYLPRTGWVTIQDELKASALIAFRAAHFITRPNQPHVYIYAGQSSSDTFEPPAAVTLTNTKWQSVSPAGDGSCHFFPMSTSLASPDDGRKAFRPDDGNFVWNMWREYGCCRDRGYFLYKIN